MTERKGLRAPAPETNLYHRLPLDLYQKIVDFINKHQYKTRTSAMNDLLNIGLIVTERINEIQDPEIVSEIRAQLHEGGLVNYVKTLNPHQLEVLWSIVDTEMKDRDQQWRSKLGNKPKINVLD